MRTKIVLLLCLLLKISYPQYPLNDVSLNHPIYSFIEKISTEYHIVFPSMNQRPWNRSQVRHFLQKLLSDSVKFNTMNEIDKREFSTYALEFLPEYKIEKKWSLYPFAAQIYKQVPLHRYFYQNGWNFYHYKTDRLEFTLNPQLRVVKFWNRTENTSELHISNGYEINGRYSDHIGFYWNLVDNTFSGDFAVPPRNVFKDSGYPFISPSGNSFSWNENIFYLTFKWKDIYFEIGRNFLVWGPGERDHIILSTNAPAFDQLKLQFHSKYVNYTVVTGKLFAPVDTILAIRDMPKSSKYLAAQRVDITPSRYFQIGWTQLIVYANRNIELGYALPFSFFKSSEHYYGDRDNSLMAVDVQIFPFKHITGYVTWLIDDMTTSKIGTNFYGNKFAFQFGLKMYNVSLLSTQHNIFMEYIKIDPYVYSHRFENATEYKHYDSHLGSYLEPNSDMFYQKWEWLLFKSFKLIGEYEYIRHGENLPDVNVGGSVDLPHRPGDPEYIPFLSGHKVYTSRMFLTVDWNYFRKSNVFFTFLREKRTGSSWKNKIWIGITLSFGNRPYKPIYRF